MVTQRVRGAQLSALAPHKNLQEHCLGFSGCQSGPGTQRPKLRTKPAPSVLKCCWFELCGSDFTRSISQEGELRLSSLVLGAQTAPSLHLFLAGATLPLLWGNAVRLNSPTRQDRLCLAQKSLFKNYRLWLFLWKHFSPHANEARGSKTTPSLRPSSFFEP